MHPVLDRLGLGGRHEADADGRVLVGPDDDLVLPLRQHRPAERLRPEPGQAGQVVSVNDDVVQPDGHAKQYARHAGPHLANLYSAGPNRVVGPAGTVRAEPDARKRMRALWRRLRTWR